MSQLTPGQARVIDPILSTQARGYRSPGNVGMFLFPRVYVAQRGGKVIEFGKEAFRRYSSARAPGGNTKRIQFGYEGKPYGIGLNSLEGMVPRELWQEANAVPSINLATRAVALVQRSLALNHEVACAGIAQNVANYDANHKVALAGAARWDDAASTPVKNVADWQEAIRATTGVRPNVGVIGPKVFAALKTNPQITDRIKYTGRDVVTTDLLKSLFELDALYVGEAIEADDAGAFTDVWGKNVVLAYVPKTESFAQEEPSYGYTYTMQGHPAVEQPYYENNTKSWIYPVSDDSTPVLTGITAGYLATTVVS
jgi:hypothetical protein